MGRRRFVQIDGELVEITPGMEDLAKPRATAKNEVLWNDRAYQDMGDPRFKSRSQHRDYMRAAGVTTTDDFRGVWKKAEGERIRNRTAQQGFTRQEIIRSIEKLNGGYKPRIAKED